MQDDEQWVQSLEPQLRVVDIYNTEGYLEVATLHGRCFCTINRYADKPWTEIPQYLYDAIVKYASS